MSGNSLIVLVSGVFHAVYNEVFPAFEREAGIEVNSELSPSLGDPPQSVESRLARGEDADALIMVGRGLDAIIAKDMVLDGTRVELARAPIGLAMKKGAARPDISTPDRLRKRCCPPPRSATRSARAGNMSRANCLTSLASRRRWTARPMRCRV